MANHLQSSLTPCFPLKEFVHQIVRVAVVEGPGDVSDTQLILLHLKQNGRSIGIAKS